MGTASAVATRPLNRIPIFINSPRRESVFSFDIIRLLVLRVIRNGIRLSRVRSPPRGEPGNYVGDFLVRHGLAGHVSAPVWRSQFGTTGDDNGAQPLIADEREKGIIRDGAALWSSVAARAVARFAIRFVGKFASQSVARGLRRIGRRTGCVENSAPAPARSDFARDHINLLLRQHSPGALPEVRHPRSPPSFHAHFPQPPPPHDTHTL